LDPTGFVRAKNRKFDGLTRDEEGKWQGDYYFVLIADPQFGQYTALAIISALNAAFLTPQCLLQGF
jgi:hypothetical protein